MNEYSWNNATLNWTIGPIGPIWVAQNGTCCLSAPLLQGWGVSSAWLLGPAGWGNETPKSKLLKRLLTCSIICARLARLDRS